MVHRKDSSLFLQMHWSLTTKFTEINFEFRFRKVFAKVVYYYRRFKFCSGKLKFRIMFLWDFMLDFRSQWDQSYGD
jgi:hypothetical protein